MSADDSPDSQDKKVDMAAVSKVKVSAKKEKRGVIYLSSIPEGKVFNVKISWPYFIFLMTIELFYLMIQV